MRHPVRKPTARPVETVDAADRRLCAQLDRGFREVAARAGRWLACAPGCTECCRSLFPITRLDARRLQRGLAELGETEPHRARAVARRARDAADRLSRGRPGPTPGVRLTTGETQLDRFFSARAGLACPALDPASGRCDLYAWRPVACRTYGPPLRFGGRDAPSCRLCFDGAPAEEVERCRFRPDPEGRETQLLQRIGVSEEEPWHTLIAFALAGR